MTEHHPSRTQHDHQHDYLPAAGRDAFLPFYDLFTRLLGATALHRVLIGQADLAPGQRVLEIGCGTGNLSLRVKRTSPGVDLTGSDPDPLALERAQRKARGMSGIRFERGYAQRLPYPDAEFDRVFSSLMFHHLDADAKVATAAEIARVLRPGGRLQLADFVGERPGAGSGRHNLHGFLSKRVAKAGHLTHNRGEDIPRLLTGAGLECTELTTRRHPLLGEITYYQALRPA